jgi:hypothetical protein
MLLQVKRIDQETGYMHNRKSFMFVVLAAAAMVFASACTVTELGQISLNCGGWGASGWGFSSGGTVYATATDGDGNVILGPNAVVGTIPSGSSSGLSGSGSWATAPTSPYITLTLSVGPNIRTIHADCRPGKSFTDGRLNQEADQTGTAYCTADHGIRVFAIYKNTGYIAFTVSAKQIANGLAKAISTGKHVKIASGVGHELWALSSNQLQLHNAMGIDYNAYFAPDVCAG